MAIATAQPKPKALPKPGLLSSPAFRPTADPTHPSGVNYTAPNVAAFNNNLVAAPPALASVAQPFQSAPSGPSQPNYGALLAGMPDFTEAEGNYQASLDAAHNARRLRMRQALIKLGFLPGSAEQAALEGIDPSTAQVAAGNSESALAQLGLVRDRQRSDLSASLAARGILNSGALRGGENLVQDTYNTGLNSATSGYLDEQNQALADEAAGISTGQSNFSAAKYAAAAAAAVNPLFRPVYGASTDTMPVLSAGQGSRPDQTPVLAKPPSVIAKPPPAPKKPAPKPKRTQGGV